MQHLNICVSFYTQLWFLWSLQLITFSDGCDTKIYLARDTWYVGMGHNFTLTCNFVCTSKSISLHWYKGTSRVLNQTTNQTNFTFPLHVESAEQNHSGEYYCQTHPPVVSSNTVFIKVVDLSLNVSRTSVEVVEGQRAEVNCTAISPLNTSLFWGLGGCEEHHKVNGQATLLLFPAALHHSGDYYCCSSIPTLIPLFKSKKVVVTVLCSQEVLQCLLVWYLMSKTGIIFLIFAVLFILASRGHY